MRRSEILETKGISCRMRRCVTIKKHYGKPDIILKNFWRDNRHFADLFNAALFAGKQVLKPDDLREADTDISSILKFNGHIDTVQKVFDVVKKTAHGVDFALWGLENQNKIHYAMPLRHMLGDSFSYLKEYNEIAARNKLEKHFKSSDEFLGNFRQTDRLHPVISLCVYYGEDEWNGPVCLKDMLKIPQNLETLVSDYKMNLPQVRKSEMLPFQNSEVATVFEVSRLIYEDDYQKIMDIYKDKTISSELGAVIGAITGAQNFIDYILDVEEKGDEIYMCKSLDRWAEMHRQEGISEGRSEGIKATVRVCKNFNISKKDIIENIMREFSIPEEETIAYVEKYW